MRSVGFSQHARKAGEGSPRRPSPLPLSQGRGVLRHPPTPPTLTAPPPAVPRAARRRAWRHSGLEKAGSADKKSGLRKLERQSHWLNFNMGAVFRGWKMCPGTALRDRGLFGLGGHSVRRAPNKLRRGTCTSPEYSQRYIQIQRHPACVLTIRSSGARVHPRTCMVEASANQRVC